MNAAQPTAAANFQTIEARRATIRGSVIAGAELTGPYLAMKVAAASIAGFGLMENSPAVIIGAMLIAMLFGPIIGIAMALAEADLRLLGRALKAEIVGAICVLAIGCLIGLSTRHLTIGSDALNQMARYLAGLPGRKNLIWFSGSFPISILPGVFDSTKGEPQLPSHLRFELISILTAFHLESWRTYSEY
jgi:hypothetical protein